MALFHFETDIKNIKKVVNIVIGLIILISICFVAYVVYKTAKVKILKYILTPIISVLYGVMLFFVGMSISSVLFLILAIIPLIVGVVYIIKQK